MSIQKQSKKKLSNTFVLLLVLIQMVLNPLNQPVNYGSFAMERYIGNSVPPPTLVEITLNDADEPNLFDVNLVDIYNLSMIMES